jgi:hypothetical protein
VCAYAGEVGKCQPATHTSSKRVRMAQCVTWLTLPNAPLLLAVPTTAACSPFLQRLPEDLASMTGLQDLAVLGSPSGLSQIPDSIAALTALRELKLHGCHNLQVSRQPAARLQCCHSPGPAPEAPAEVLQNMVRFCIT